MDPKCDVTRGETVASNRLAGRPVAEISGLWSTSSVQQAVGRVLPGTLRGGCYRILTLVGRGGMGEVYRAMDLTLGQSVALKFLPEAACHHQRLLGRFHGEVRGGRLG